MYIHNEYVYKYIDICIYIYLRISFRESCREFWVPHGLDTLQLRRFCTTVLATILISKLAVRKLGCSVNFFEGSYISEFSYGPLFRAPLVLVGSVPWAPVLYVVNIGYIGVQMRGSY